MNPPPTSPRPAAPHSRRVPSPAPTGPGAHAVGPVRPGASNDRPIGRGTVPRTSLAAPWDRVRLTLPAPVLQVDTTATPCGIPPQEPGPWAGAVVRTSVEALLGIRPATQLERWLTPELYDAVRRRSGLALRVLGRPSLPLAPRVLSYRAQPSRSGTEIEASVVVHDGTKVRAAAVRLEAFRGRWRAVALEIG